jgi:signal transduction histidine kinase
MIKKNDHESKHGLKLVLQELDDNPYKRFNMAFALMSIIPFLVFVYIIAARLFTLDIFCGDVGLIVFLTMAVAFLGFSIGYRILKNILNKIIYYAAKAKQGDQTKSEFVASVSHELKNPLTVIKITLSNLRDGILGPVSESQKKAIEMVQDVTSRMTQLINDILDLHKIEAGKVEVSRKLCDLSEIMERQANELEVIAEKKHIKMAKNVSGRDLNVWADEDKITRVINNLLSNAIKYTPEAGSVKMNTYRSDGFIRMEIEDTAAPIPHDDLEKIFDKFKRLESKAEGTGLGLAIAKDIVEMHKGRIWAEHGGAAGTQGNKFVVVLPSDLRSSGR